MKNPERIQVERRAPDAGRGKSKITWAEIICMAVALLIGLVICAVMN